MFGHELIIAPSLLAADAANLGRDVNAAKRGGAAILHFDVMDAHFVPNLSFGPHICAALARVTDMPLDVHLMVSDPSGLTDAFLDGGAALVTVHAEVGDSAVSALQKVKRAGKYAGVSIKPAADIEAVLPFLHLADMVLIMTVEPGFGGQSFLPNSLSRIRAMRQLLNREKPSCRLQVDGGINTENILGCAAAGADIFVAGSAAFGKTEQETERKVRALKAALNLT
ncbi:MAG: ribulose-phosphate 3-epimerase [Oscillospiraceae bacterium]|nr:ribulose-phosphate 3-epimerase [Oscillospiraceae bacterium]